MSLAISDVFPVNNLNKKARGGTELMAERVFNTVPHDLLSKFVIHQSRVEELSKGKINLFWAHDLPEDPASDKFLLSSFRHQFAKMIFVSDWQLQGYNTLLKVPYSDSIVLKNAIEPFEKDTLTKVSDCETIRLIYHTTPHRGLQILVPVFEWLANKYDNIELDVFSSFSIYGWDQRDEPYQELFERIKAHPKMHYHGAVSNEEVREALKKAHIFAYPSIWKETSCLALIEAMSAGCLCVHPNLAALPETSGGLNVMYNWDEDLNRHANIFLQVLESAIAGYNENISNRLVYTKGYADSVYSMKLRSLEWTGLLTSLAQNPY